MYTFNSQGHQILRAKFHRKGLATVQDIHDYESHFLGHCTCAQQALETLDCSNSDNGNSYTCWMMGDICLFGSVIFQDIGHIL